MFLKNISHFGFGVDAGFWIPARLVYDGEGSEAERAPAGPAQTPAVLDAAAAARQAEARQAQLAAAAARARAAREAGDREAAARTTPRQAPPAAGPRAPETPTAQPAGPEAAPPAAPTTPAAGTQGPTEVAPTAAPVTQQEKDELTKKTGFELPADEEEIQKRLRGEIQGKPLTQREAEICRAILQDKQRAQEVAPGSIFGFNKKELAEMFKMGMEEVKKAIAALTALLKSFRLGGTPQAPASAPEAQAQTPELPELKVDNPPIDLAAGQKLRLTARPLSVEHGKAFACGPGTAVKMISKGKITAVERAGAVANVTIEFKDNKKIKIMGLKNDGTLTAAVNQTPDAGALLGQVYGNAFNIAYFENGTAKDPKELLSAYWPATAPTPAPAAPAKPPSAAPQAPAAGIT